MLECNKDCFANNKGRCVALEVPYEDDCPFQKKIARMMRLYESDGDFACYVNKYLAQHRDMRGLNYALIVEIVVAYGEEIIRNKGLNI